MFYINTILLALLAQSALLPPGSGSRMSPKMQIRKAELITNTDTGNIE